MNPQAEGRKYEVELAKSFGGEVVEGSGNQPFCKLDVRGKKILISAKWTGKKTYTLTGDVLKEAEHAIDGPGGLGGSWVPAVACSVGGGDYIILRTSDFIRIVKDDVKLAVPTSQGEARAATARTPALFRKE